MSLKAFHLIFICLSTLFALGFAVWFIQRYSIEGDALLLVAAISSTLVAIGLVTYGVRFMKKLRHISYL